MSGCACWGHNPEFTGSSSSTWQERSLGVWIRLLTSWLRNTGYIDLQQGEINTFEPSWNAAVLQLSRWAPPSMISGRVLQLLSGLCLCKKTTTAPWCESCARNICSMSSMHLEESGRGSSSPNSWPWEVVDSNFVTARPPGFWQEESIGIKSQLLPIDVKRCIEHVLSTVRPLKGSCPGFLVLLSCWQSEAKKVSTNSPCPCTLNSCCQVSAHGGGSH